MGGGRQNSDHLPPELGDEVAATPLLTATSDHHPDISVIAEEEAATCCCQRRCKACFELMKNSENSPVRADSLRAAKDLILKHKPGDWIEEVGGKTVGDYQVPASITLLLLGPRGSGKSTLVNRITRVFDDGLSAPDRAQVSYNLFATGGTFFLQEYPIPRKSKSLCIYDTRSLSIIPSENLKLLERWMTRGVRHGEMVSRDSDDIAMRKRIQLMSRNGLFSSCEKTTVNFVIFIVDGDSVLKSIDEKQNGYCEMLRETYNYPFLSFKDSKPAVVVTHGDKLSFPQRVRVHAHLGDLLGIPPIQQIFDIPGASDYETESAVLDMLRFCIEHADRNLVLKQKNSLKGQWTVDQLVQMSRKDCVLLGAYVGILLFMITLIASVYVSQIIFATNQKCNKQFRSW